MSKFQAKIPTMEEVPHLKGVFKITHDDGRIEYGKIASDEESIIYNIDLILEHQDDIKFIENFTTIFIDIINSNSQLKTLPNLINTRNSSNINLLTCAVLMNCIESTKYLLDNFSNLQFTHKSEGKDSCTNPLVDAITMNKKLEIIQLLIDYIIKHNIEKNFLCENPIICALFRYCINKQSINTLHSVSLIDKIIDTLISVSSIQHIIHEDICEEYLITSSKSPLHRMILDNILRRIIEYMKTLSSSENITLETLFEEDNLLKENFITFFHSKFFKTMVANMDSASIEYTLYIRLNLTFCFNITCDKLIRYDCLCFRAKYCSKKCQKHHRKIHKKYCYIAPTKKLPIETEQIDTSIKVENDK
jgi:hypothetical protein